MTETGNLLPPRFELGAIVSHLPAGSNDEWVIGEVIEYVSPAPGIPIVYARIRRSDDSPRICPVESLTRATAEQIAKFRSEKEARSGK